MEANIISTIMTDIHKKLQVWPHSLKTSVCPDMTSGTDITDALSNVQTMGFTRPSDIQYKHTK